MSEIKSCPFCGGEAEKRRFSWGNVDYNDWYVTCKTCGVRTKILNQEEAIEAWNRRDGAE